MVVSGWGEEMSCGSMIGLSLLMAEGNGNPLECAGAW